MLLKSNASGVNNSAGYLKSSDFCGVVQLPSAFVQFLLREAIHVTALGQLLPQQAVDTLVGVRCHFSLLIVFHLAPIAYMTKSLPRRFRAGLPTLTSTANRVMCSNSLRCAPYMNMIPIIERSSQFGFNSRPRRNWICLNSQC